MDKLEFPLFSKRVTQIHHGTGGSVLEAMRPQIRCSALVLGYFHTKNKVIQPGLVTQAK